MKMVRLLTFCLMLGALAVIPIVAVAQQIDAAADPNAAGQPGQPNSDLPISQDEPALHERSMLPGDQQQIGEPAMADEAKRAELGVWLVATEGPGVRIRRITSGSAAEKAGLQSGDIILQVNRKWASSPQAVAEMVRQMPIGEQLALQVWRDGQPQELAATIQAPQPIMQPRDAYQVGFRGEEASANGDLGARTMRLEQQLKGVLQELQQLRQEVGQLRTSAGSAATDAIGGGGTSVGTTSATAPAPGFEQPNATDTQPAQPAAPADAAAATAPADAAAPADDAAATDPFGTDAAQPKAEEESSTTDSDSLFQ